jgi:hypothetical protein
MVVLFEKVYCAVCTLHIACTVTTLADSMYCMHSDNTCRQRALQHCTVQQLHRNDEDRLAGHVVLLPRLLEGELGERHLRDPRDVLEILEILEILEVLPLLDCLG